jgi:hypothetical protein
VEVEDKSDTPSESFGSGLPPYDGNEFGQSSARTQNVGSEHDDFGTVVTELNVVTTRKKYRVYT